MQSSLSPEEKEILNRMAEYQQETDILDSSGQFYQVVLVLLGEKPATHIAATNNILAMTIKEALLESLTSYIPLYTTPRAKTRQEMYSIAKELTNLDTNIVAVESEQNNSLLIYNSNQTTKNQLIEVQEKSPDEHNAAIVGAFFGYPEDARKNYKNNKESDKTQYQKVKSFLEESDEYNVDGYHRATEFISYIPNPTKESFEQALQTTQERKELLESVDLDEYNALNQYISERISRCDVSKVRNE